MPALGAARQIYAVPGFARHAVNRSGIDFMKQEDWQRPVRFCLEEACRKYPHRPAIDFLGACWSYHDLALETDRIACGLQAMGVKKGDAIALFLPNTPYFTFYFFAAQKIGAAVVALNPLNPARDIALQIENAGARIVVTMDLVRLYDKIHDLPGRKIIDKIVICPMGAILPALKRVAFFIAKSGERARIAKDDVHVSHAGIAPPGARPASVDIDPQHDIAVIQYTGGTTGQAKGALLTHANLMSSVGQITRVFGSADFELEPGAEKTLCILPFFHVFGMSVAQNFSIWIGAQLVMIPRFDLDQVLRAIKRRKVTLFPGVPTIYSYINNRPDIANHDLSSVKLCLSGGAPLPVNECARFEALTGSILVEGYGLTESSSVVAVNPLSTARRPGSVGRALSETEVEIRDLDDLERCMGPGEAGEVWVAGPQVMKGYLNHHEESKQALPGKWLRTGDVGYCDADGFIFLIDRIKDIIICSGYNVYPRRIEEALYAHEAVEEAVVIGVPDALKGEVPKAFIKLHDGHARLETNALVDFLKQHLSPIEMPRQFEFRDSLPKTMVGKLSKRELAQAPQHTGQEKAAGEGRAKARTAGS